MSQLNSYELCQKHDLEDKCCFCHGFNENWAYTYEEAYKFYLGHLRNLYVYDCCQFDKMERYKNFLRRCQYNNFFSKDSIGIL